MLPGTSLACHDGHLVQFPSCPCLVFTHFPDAFQLYPSQLNPNPVAVAIAIAKASGSTPHGANVAGLSGR